MNKNNYIRLFISNGNSYPLWLTKDLILYVKGQKMFNCVDWKRSSRNCLFVKKQKIKLFKRTSFFYPDGNAFILCEESDDSTSTV